MSIFYGMRTTLATAISCAATVGLIQVLAMIVKALSVFGLIPAVVAVLLILCGLVYVEYFTVLTKASYELSHLILLPFVYILTKAGLLRDFEPEWP
jgi:hypothetical protein